MFIGFHELGETLPFVFIIRDNGLAPLNADQAPICRVYGPSGLLPSVTGTFSLFDTATTITGAADLVGGAGPIVYTCSAPHGLVAQTVVTVTGITGNTAANTTGIVQSTSLTATQFALLGVSNGAYSAGGTWNVTGLYGTTIACTSLNGFETGKSYVILVEGVAQGVPFSYTFTFLIS